MMKMDGVRIDRLDTGGKDRIVELLNNAWLQIYGSNSIMFTQDFLCDIFHPLLLDERISIGIYDASGELQGLNCAFKVPVYYRKLGRTCNSIYGSLYVIDERFRNAGLSFKIVKGVLDLARLGYTQCVVLAMPKAISSILIASRNLDALLETINFDYSPSSSFNVRILVNRIFKDITLPTDYLADMEIGPVEEGLFNEYIKFMDRKKLEVDAFSDYPVDVWRYIFFGMKEKKAWHCYHNNQLIAVLFANIHRTMASNVPNGYIEIYAQDALNGEIFFSLTYKFIRLLRDSLGINEILIQNPSFYNDRFLSELKKLGFGQTRTKHIFHIFSLRDEHLKTMAESASWIYPIF
jgi:hypothetical protein